MKNSGVYIYGTLLALPFIGLLIYVLNPPQCPPSYTQAQVEASRCIVGANMGLPFLLFLIPSMWYVAVLIAGRVLGRNYKK